jgi:hypothetical protein
MNRIILTSLLALALGGAAMAQTSSANLSSGTTTQNKTGIAKPPPGTVPPSPRRINRMSGSQLGNNTPTLPQIALRPSATIGSPVPIAGPGGTSRNPTGN